MADGTTGSYLFDLQGNTAEIITASGVKVNAAYNAWGRCNHMNPVPFPNNPFMQHSYNARWGYLLDETGLYYCQNRYYDPSTGRFLTRDPISYSGGMNLYGYCGVIRLELLIRVDSMLWFLKQMSVTLGFQFGITRDGTS